MYHPLPPKKYLWLHTYHNFTSKASLNPAAKKNMVSYICIKFLASTKYICMRRGMQQASEGCSSKAGPSWVLACLADHKPLHLIRFDLEDILPSLPALMYVRPPASVTLD